MGILYLQRIIADLYDYSISSQGRLHIFVLIYVRINMHDKII